MKLRAFLLAWSSMVAAIVPSHATTVLAPSFESLVADAEIVVHGVVTGVRCERRVVGESHWIVTLVTVRTLEIAVGPEVPEIVLQLLGGEIDGDELRVAGQPRFQVGDEDVLFISGNGQQLCPLVRMRYGRYLVAKNEEGRPFVARDNGVPLAAVAEVATQLVEGGAADLLTRLKAGDGLAPGQFLDAVRETARRQGRRDVM